MEEEISQAQIDKPKQKRGLKIFTFFSGLFDIINGVVILGSLIKMIIDFFDWTRQGANILISTLFSPLVIVFFTILAVSIFLFLILGIMTVIASFKSDKKNWNGLSITAVVFDFLILILSLFLVAILPGDSLINLIVVASLTGIGGLLKIIDLFLISHRNKKFKREHPEISEQTTKIDFSKLSENEKIENEEDK